MDLPLMPKATAVWLVENTALTFEQIGNFCGLHALEVQAIADDEVAVGIHPLDPITSGQLTQDELERCLANSKEQLQLHTSELGGRKPMKGAKYTPVSKRQDRPNAISWLLRQYPELGDAQICRLIGTTKTTITAVRDRTHWNTSKIQPHNPVLLGLCTAAELNKAVERARARAERAKKKAEKAQAASAKKSPVATKAKAAKTAKAPAVESAPEEAPAAEVPAVESATEEAPAAEAPAVESATEEAPEDSPKGGEVH